MVDKVDENLYSRQLAVYGESMGQLVRMKVFIYGLRGVGIETAKNLILAGPKQVIIQDDTTVHQRDLGVNFYIKEEDIGKKSRAQACVQELKDLNPYVNVDVHQGEVTTDYLNNFDVIMFTDYYNQEKLTEFNNFCRKSKKGFITSGLLGLAGYAFVDFGEEFRCLDKNGEEVKNCIVAGITQEQAGVVHCHDDKRHGFEDGDSVTFREVQGMDEVNGQVYKIQIKSPHSFSIDCDTNKFKNYTREGIVEQVKTPEIMNFKSYSDSLKNPVAPGKDCLEICDYTKMGRAEELHEIYCGLLRFQAQNNRLPGIQNEQDFQTLLKDIQSNKNKDVDVNPTNVKIVSYFADCQLTCFASFWGGILAQEIVKWTGKFAPLRQWLYIDYFETFDEKADRSNIQQTRYFDQQNIYGNEIQNKIRNLNIFQVGAGALGCEFLKLFALQGYGNVQVTDDDQIETSNLNRQFLFRKENVGQSKSEAACNRVKRMNGELKTKSIKLRVAPENEEIFDDNFWTNLNFVVNAVDNVKARMYVDSKCVWYGKALFESGTLGTKCNSQIVIPKLTQSYGESQDPPEESIPLCTLKNFPHQIEHTIQWGRDYFEGMLVDGPNETLQYVENPAKYLESKQREFKGKDSMLREIFDRVMKLVTAYNKNSYEACVELARNMFEDIFHNQIAQLLYSFPIDHKTTEGALFWSGPKRPPTPVVFDINDPMHLQFIQACANIYAYTFGLKYNSDLNQIKKICSSVKVQPFQPKKCTIKVNDNDPVEEKIEDDELVVENLTKELQSLKIKNKNKMNQNEFEKDDATNYHIAFISAVANLRARNYKIAEVTDFKVKLIAGKIIPALATTTAMVCGQVGMEIIKYLQGKPLEDMKNSFMNLALPFWMFSEPMAPNKAQDKDYDPILLGPVKSIPKGFTTWDKIDVDGPLTVEGLKVFFQKNYNVDINMVIIGSAVCYNQYGGDEGFKSDLAQRYEQISKKTIPHYKRYLELTIAGEQDGVDVNMPGIRYKFR